MAQKSKMTAYFEKLVYTSDILRSSWEDQLVIFKNLKITRTPNQGISNFIEWILRLHYSEALFASSSLWRLMISKPTTYGKLNYQQTLKIEFDSRIALYTMEYSDWDTIDTKEDNEKAILWKTKCTWIELVPRFKDFLHWNTQW